MLEQELTSGLTAPGMYSSYSVFSIKYSHLPTVHSLLVEKSRTSTSRPASYVCKTMKIYDFQQVFSSVSLRSKPPCQEGSGSLPVGGFAAQALRTKPPCQEGSGSLPVGGFAAQGSRTSPTHQEGYLPPRGVALMHGGQIPITPQSKTNSLLPPATQYVFD